MKRVIVIALIGIALFVTPVQAEELIKGRATVYSTEGITKTGTQTRIGMCASSDKELMGKQVIVYQRLPDNSKGDALGIYTVEDTGCKANVIDLWYPESISNKVIEKTYEDGCEGKVYIQVVGVAK